MKRPDVVIAVVTALNVLILHLSAMHVHKELVFITINVLLNLIVI
jgi:hypothetical protein